MSPVWEMADVGMWGRGDVGDATNLLPILLQLVIELLRITYKLSPI